MTSIHLKHKNQPKAGARLARPLPEPQAGRRGNPAGVRSTALKIPPAACKRRCSGRAGWPRAGEVPRARPGVPAAGRLAEGSRRRREPGFFAPCSRGDPAPASRKQDPGEGSVLWTERTCLVNINWRPGRAGGVGRRERDELGPLPRSPPCFLGMPCGRFGSAHPLPKLCAWAGHDPAPFLIASPIYSVLSPAPCRGCLAQAVLPPISFHSPAAEQAPRHQQPALAAYPAL